MKVFLKGILAFVLAILLFFSIGFFTGNLGLTWREYFGVRKQNIETHIYKNTEMYNEAKVQQLAKTKREYEAAGDHVAGYKVGKMPQPEPNGLFMPDNLSATWVFLVGKDGHPHPVYVEPRIMVSPFKIDLQ